MNAQDFTLLKYSLVQWLCLNGIETEAVELPGTAWVTAPKAIAPPAPLETARMIAPQIGSSSNLDLEKATSLQDFNSFILAWKESGLAKTAFSTVLGTGVLQPRLMVISDMPDDTEDRSGEGFSSNYNMLILQALSALGFNNNAMYKTYLSKWRAPSRRSLSTMEAAICAQMLRHEIRLVMNTGIDFRSHV